ncbi:hypothetical protein GQX74_000277 [Glossina fuscipes]|nr:hypothetical protein GQX74_000277 [Glossina fuscipes]
MNNSPEWCRLALEGSSPSNNTMGGQLPLVIRQIKRKQRRSRNTHNNRSSVQSSQSVHNNSTPSPARSRAIETNSTNQFPIVSSDENNVITDSNNNGGNEILQYLQGYHEISFKNQRNPPISSTSRPQHKNSRSYCVKLVKCLDHLTKSCTKIPPKWINYLQCPPTNYQDCFTYQ